MKKIEITTKSSRDVAAPKRKAEWHPFGNAIILISVIIAILIVFWFAL